VLSQLRGDFSKPQAAKPTADALLKIACASVDLLI